MIRTVRCYCRVAREFRRSDLIINRIDSSLRKPVPFLEDLLFGRHFSDHMLIAEWKDESAINTVDSIGTKSDGIPGWSNIRIQPYQGLTLPPSASVFHYGIEAFEGMKAYKDSKGNIRMFRPMLNMFRFKMSAERLRLPTFEENEMLACIQELVRLDSSWIPSERGYSLYIRPTMIGIQDSLGVSESNKALFYTICSPVGPYYRSGFKAISLFAEEHYVRAWYGGTGCYKIGGNYAPTILPQMKAAAQGCQQNLWLLGPDLAITEVGAMNIFVFWENESGVLELVTSPLDGTVLPGVTRASVLELTKSWGEFVVREGKITMYEVEKAIREKRMKEIFGSGTAVVISPIKAIHFRGKVLDIPLDPNELDSQAGPLAKRLSSTLQDIQFGEKEFQDWSCIVA